VHNPLSWIDPFGLSCTDPHNAADFARYKESLARQQFADEAQWKTTAAHGDELTYHAYDRHPSLATTDRGVIDPSLYDARARANITNPSSEIHQLSPGGNTRYGAFNPDTGEFTVFSTQGGGASLPPGTPTIHSYYTPLRNQMMNGSPFTSYGQVPMTRIYP
jgi:hypothetical protein